MLFRNPQLLWFLWILAIPILIHLLRLRSFKKTPFTNVRLLQQLIVESNRGNQLKKWLILISRLGLFTALILAFAQPFIPNNQIAQQKDIAIYLDNSFSMQATSGSTNLLEDAIQDLIQGLPQDFEFALLTNDDQFGIETLANHQEFLLGLDFATEQSDLQSIVLRLESLFSQKNKPRELWMISDFKELNLNQKIPKEIEIHTVQLKPANNKNVSLDTLFISDRKNEQLELQINISFSDSNQVTPVSLFDGDSLIAKSFPEFTGNNSGKALFNLAVDTEIDGSIRLTDGGLIYDNSLFFNLKSPPKIKVSIIGDTINKFLSRLFSDEEFLLKDINPGEIDLRQLQSNNLIILNELSEIPISWLTPLKNFLDYGNSLLIIPSTDGNSDSYNRFLLEISDVRFGNLNASTEKITEINYGHPLFQGVFEGETNNFDYPNVLKYFKLKSPSSGVLNFQNGDPFLVGSNRVFVLASSLKSEISNFSQSPLIVPTFYNIGKQSLPFPELYFNMGQPAVYDVNLALGSEEIVSLQNSEYDFIPQQQLYPEKVRLTFNSEPEKAGNYSMRNRDGKQLGTVSFNYLRTESRALNPISISLPILKNHESLEELFKKHRNESGIHELWKWFAILALLFMAAELILQKTLK